MQKLLNESGVFLWPNTTVLYRLEFGRVKPSIQIAQSVLRSMRRISTITECIRFRRITSSNNQHHVIIRQLAEEEGICAAHIGVQTALPSQLLTLTESCAEHDNTVMHLLLFDIETLLPRCK